tara:strand:+ start:155 stop:430 length:276 start_codon:yes stop_codon:yes gene_type:complete
MNSSEHVNNLEHKLNSQIGFANSQHLIHGGWKPTSNRNSNSSSKKAGKNKSKKKVDKRKRYKKKSYKKLFKKNKFKNHYKYTRKLNKAFFY